MEQQQDAEQSQPAADASAVLQQGPEGDAKKQPIDWRERALRLQAEMENYKKRLDRQYDHALTGERHRIFKDMAPLADHLDLALRYSDQITPDGAEEQMARLRQNLESTKDAFLHALAQYGVRRIDPRGEPFDPAQQEAISQMPSTTVPAGHVVTVMQPGYIEGDQVIRPARVVVSRGAAEAEDAGEAEA